MPAATISIVSPIVEGVYGDLFRDDVAHRDGDQFFVGIHEGIISRKDAKAPRSETSLCGLASLREIIGLAPPGNEVEPVMGSEKGDAVVINAQFVAAGVHIHSWLRHEIAKIGFAHGGEEDNSIVITAGDAFP